LLGLPLGQLPVLKFDGVIYAQTQAINNYCAKLANFPKLTDKEELRNHMVIETCAEVFNAIVKPAFGAKAAAGTL
jgi:glutathione S-transferase